jgi:hypothetical protein
LRRARTTSWPCARVKRRAICSTDCMDIILNHENEEVYSWNFCPIFLNATPGPVCWKKGYFTFNTKISICGTSIRNIYTITRVKWMVHDHPRSRTSLIHIVDRLSRRCYPTMHVREMIVEV